MTRSDLVKRISEIYPYMPIADVERIVTVVIDSIITTLKEHGRVELRGFGAFGVKHRSPGPARNPKTGEKVSVSQRVVPFFRSGKFLKDLVNGIKFKN